MLSNGLIAETLAAAAQDEDGHRRRALDRASRAAMFAWTEEAAALVERDEPLTSLLAVGPWVAARILALVADPPDDVPPPEIRSGFLTLAEVRAALASDPERVASLGGDLQMHTTFSDGAESIREMAGSGEALGYAFVGITDHSKSLKVAHGMDEERLANHGREIEALNAEAAAVASGFRALRSIEMDLTPEGDGDMDLAALARLDLVLGAFHTKLRQTDDQTERYVAAVRNPTVTVLAHPTTRKWGRRLGLPADWPAVFEAAFEAGTAVEIDGSPDRQDLPVPLLQAAVESGVTFSLGSDAHAPGELAFIDYAMAAAIIAAVPVERILNHRAADDVVAWAANGR